MIESSTPTVTAPAQPVPLRAWDGTHGTPDGFDAERIALVRGRWASQDAALLARDKQIEETGRTCNACGVWKPRAEMAANRSYANGMDARCRACKRAAELARYYRDHDANKAKLRERGRARYKHNREAVRAAQIKCAYGVTTEQYDAQYAAQDGRCAICARRPTKRLVIDHDHATGAFRGLLCRTCNLAIGLLADNTGWIASAGEYLARSRS